MFFITSRQEHGKEAKERQTFDSVKFDPRRPEDQSLDSDDAEKLFKALQQCNPMCNFVKYFNSDRPVEPAHNAKNPNRLAYLPPSITEIKEACLEFKSSLVLTDQEIGELEIKTRTQSDSKDWIEARKHRLTASNFHRVSNRKPSTDPKNLLCSLLYSKTKQTAAMAFGLRQEDKAATRYSERKGVKLETRGLIVHKDKPFLGASIDRIVCSENEKKIVEIKNPQSTWKMTIDQACDKLACLVRDENNCVKLNVRNAYYTQIQGQMAITRINTCDFVLCTESDMFIEEVLFDEAFWRNCAKKLESFYDNILLPEIVYPSVKYGLNVLDLNKL